MVCKKSVAKKKTEIRNKPDSVFQLSFL